MSLESRSTRAAGVMSLVFGALLFVPVIVLGAAIGWPASLSEPAAVLMPLIVEQEVAVRFGYLVYLAYSVLFLPAVVLIGRAVGESPTTRLAAGFAAASALARAIGILRWLTVLPAIAVAYMATPDAALAIVFDAINVYGGGIGELLGVSVFAAAAIGLLSRTIVTSTTMPTWLGHFGYLATAALLLPWLEVFGVDLGAILSVSVTVVQVFFLVAGVILLRIHWTHPVLVSESVEVAS